jgi:CRP/FNR family transcriptional regulator
MLAVASNVLEMPIRSATGPRPRPVPCGGRDSDMELIGDAASTFKSLKRDELLYRAGQPFHSLYAVRDGFFKSRVVLEDGRDQVTGFHMAGEVLGMDGIGTGRHSADIVALEASEVYVIPYERLEHPSMQRQLHKVMSRAMVRDQGVMLLLGTMRAEQRLASFLLNLSKRFMARGHCANEFHLRMTRFDIGSYLGLSLETVSRLFSRFHAAQLICVRQRHICILDVVGLRALVFPPST